MFEFGLSLALHFRYYGTVTFEPRLTPIVIYFRLLVLTPSEP